VLVKLGLDDLSRPGVGKQKLYRRETGAICARKTLQKRHFVEQKSQVGSKLGHGFLWLTQRHGGQARRA
jgi:hypothetical protein